MQQHFGDILKDQSFRYGEAMWYYALSHRPNKVREVMHFLIAWCLTQSAAYPPANELDTYLHKLLHRRNATLEELAAQDLDAAELLGTMLAGYATLRKFYDARDNQTNTKDRKRNAAAELVSVIAAADDNIRGGLYDSTRDAVVGEDFLLALLGEALVFVGGNQQQQLVLTLEQVDVLLKAVEDLQSVGGSVYETCKDFFQLVLASAPARLKGAKPADLLAAKGTSSNSSVGLAGPTMLASQLQRSVAAPSSGGGVDAAKRGWDWRSGLDYSTTAEDVLRMLRLGLTKDLARLWIVEADGGFM